MDASTTKISRAMHASTGYLVEYIFQYYKIRLAVTDIVSSSMYRSNLIIFFSLSTLMLGPICPRVQLIQFNIIDTMFLLND